MVGAINASNFFKSVVGTSSLAGSVRQLHRDSLAEVQIYSTSALGVGGVEKSKPRMRESEPWAAFHLKVAERYPHTD